MPGHRMHPDLLVLRISISQAEAVLTVNSATADKQKGLRVVFTRPYIDEREQANVE